MECIKAKTRVSGWTLIFSLHYSERKKSSILLECWCWFEDDVLSAWTGTADEIQQFLLRLYFFSLVKSNLRLKSAKATQTVWTFPLCFEINVENRPILIQLQAPPLIAVSPITSTRPHKLIVPASFPFHTWALYAIFYCTFDTNPFPK